MIDFTKPVQTRDGRQVRIYATDGAEPYCIHGATECNGKWCSTSWQRDGSFTHSGKVDNTDLVNVSRKVTLWLNIYGKSSDSTWHAYGYDSRESADRCVGCNRITCVPVEVELP